MKSDRGCVCVCERAALTRRPRCQWPLAWRWHKWCLSDGPPCPEEAPHPALGQAWARSLTVVCWPTPWLRANGARACSALPLGESFLLCPKRLAAARVSRGVCHRGGPFFGGCPKGQNAARFANTAKTVLWGRPCLALRPVRAFAFGQGVRGTALGGVRPVSYTHLTLPTKRIV